MTSLCFFRVSKQFQKLEDNINVERTNHRLSSVSSLCQKNLELEDNITIERRNHPRDYILIHVAQCLSTRLFKLESENGKEKEKWVIRAVHV